MDETSKNQKVNTALEEATTQLDKELKQESPTMNLTEQEEVQKLCIEEDPAIEALLLLQHSTNRAEMPQLASRSTPPSQKLPSAHPEEKTEDSSKTLRTSCGGNGGVDSHSMDNGMEDEDGVNPIRQFVEVGVEGLNLCVQNAGLEHFRGVFRHEKLSVFYGLIFRGGHFYFLGFFPTALEAARAWDLVALKRAFENGKNLSFSRTNFSLEKYMYLENVLGMLLVVSFNDLVEMLKYLYKDTAPGSIELEEVNEQIQRCSEKFVNEEGNIRIPVEIQERAKKAQQTFCKIQTMNPEQLSVVISKHCPDKKSTSNEWMKKIKENQSWKGVYFSSDGYPYSKVELDGKHHYLGRFDTVETAALGFDLATLKGAMMNNQSLVSLNFSVEEYIKDERLMSFLYYADITQVIAFIRELTSQSDRSPSAEENYTRGQNTHKRMKLDSSQSLFSVSNWGRTQAKTSVQQIDWSSLGLDKKQVTRKTTTLETASLPPVTSSAVTTNLSPAPVDPPVDPPAEKSSQKMDLEEDEDVYEGVQSSRKNEFRAERRICDEAMASALRDSNGWVRIALNAVALRMTNSTLYINDQQYNSFPSEINEWICPSGVGVNVYHHGDVDGSSRQTHVVEISDTAEKQSFHLTCCYNKGHYTFPAAAWNELIEDIGLTLGDILVLLKSKTSWKLSYAVFILSDAVLGGGQYIENPVMPTNPRLQTLRFQDRRFHHVHNTATTIANSTNNAATIATTNANHPHSNPASFLLRAIPMAASNVTHPFPTHGRGTLQAHVLPSAQNLTNIRLVERIHDGRLLVQASLETFPSSKGLFIIPATSLRDCPRKFRAWSSHVGASTTANSANGHPGNTGVNALAAATMGGGHLNTNNKRPFYQTHPRVVPMTHHNNNNRVCHPTFPSFPVSTRPACLPAAPIQLNIPGGFKALTQKKSDVSLLMMTDINGQMRLLSSQPNPGANPNTNPAGNVQISTFGQGIDMIGASHHQLAIPAHHPLRNSMREDRESRQQNVGLVMDSQTLQEITILTSTPTASETSEPNANVPDITSNGHLHQLSSNTNKDLDQQGESDNKLEVMSQTAGGMDTVGLKEIGESDDLSESVSSMHCQLTRILESCEGLDSDIAKHFRFVFANKMNEGQRISNFLEIKTMSEASEWKEIVEWINRTLESL